MAKVTWVGTEGDRITAEVGNGVSLMEAGVAEGVPGIIGECGGGMMCATCHVYVDDAFDVGDPGPIEEDLLDFADSPRTEKSRLSCQLICQPDMDGIVVHVPPSA